MSTDYTHPTGDGYAGVLMVSNGRISIGLRTTHVDWTAGTTVGATPVNDGVRLSGSAAEAERTLTVSDTSSGPRLAVGMAVLRPLDVDDGEQVRLYEDGSDAFLLVPRDDDPHVRADGGETIAPQCVDEHGSPTYMTDGGQYHCRWVGECRDCEKPVSTRTEGSGESEHCVRVRCGGCGATNHLTEREELGPLRADGGKRIETHQEAVECGQQSGKTERQHVTCPKCGEEWQNLPKHLPYCDGELQTDGGRPEPAVATSARVAADVDATLEPVGVALEVAEDLAETERARELIREAHQIEICQRGDD